MAVRSIEFAPPDSPNLGEAQTEDYYQDLFYRAMAYEGLLDRVDLPALLRSSVRDGIDLTPERIADYSLMPMRIPAVTPRISNFGWAEGFSGSTNGRSRPQRHSDGRFYRVYLNAPVAVSLVYQGSPQALTAFNVIDWSELFLRQIQGIRSSTRPYPLSKDDIRGSRGLAPFRYPELMVRIAEELASNAGMQSVTIKPAWMVAESDLNCDLSFDVAQRNYDQPAQALGYRLDSDQLWRKEL